VADSPSGSVTTAIEQQRGAAKWLLAAFGAVGAVTLGGLPFAKLGTAHPLWLAIAGAALAVAGVVTAISVVGLVLEIKARTPSDLVCDRRLNARITGGQALIGGHPNGLRGLIADYEEAERAAYEAAQHPDARNPDSQPRADAVEAAYRRDEFRATIEQLAELSLFLAASARFSVAKWTAAIAVIVVAIGGGCFAYATSRPAGEHTPAVSRATIVAPHRSWTVRITVKP
jgi:hypothetical protein